MPTPVPSIEMMKGALTTAHEVYPFFLKCAIYLAQKKEEFDWIVLPTKLEIVLSEGMVPQSNNPTSFECYANAFDRYPPNLEGNESPWRQNLCLALFDMTLDGVMTPNILSEDDFDSLHRELTEISYTTYMKWFDLAIAKVELILQRVDDN